MRNIKILTACGLKHTEYLSECIQSTMNFAEHLYEIDNKQEGKAAIMDRLLRKVGNYDIVGVLDADDIATPEMFSEHRLNLLNRYDVVYGDIQNVDEQGNKSLHPGRPFDRSQLYRINIIPFSGVLINGWLAKLERYPIQKHVGDWLYWNALLKHSVKFRYEPGIVSIRKTWTSYYGGSKIPVYRKVKRLLRDHNARQIIKKI